MIFAFVVVYILILVDVSFHPSRAVKTQNDFRVAGRNVPRYRVVGTLVWTWIGSGSFLTAPPPESVWRKSATRPST